MFHLNAKNIDLNLIQSLDLLLKERSVTKAAKCVGVSQSAMSHILARLRRTFQDPLFIRTKIGLLPSSRAEALGPRLEKLIEAIQDILPRDDFHAGAKRKRRQTDLNLLVALKVLLDEGNVTVAAARMGVSQSAMSHTLKRIRTQFRDAILMRKGSEMRLTERALALHRQLGWIMNEITSMLEPPVFDPAKARGVFRLALTDYSAATILPLIIDDLMVETPNLDLEIEQGHSVSFERLEMGQLDIALGSFTNEPAGFFRQRLFDDEMVCLLRADHPAVEGGLTFDGYVSMPHGVITVTGTDVLINAAFKKLGLKRRAALSFPHFLAAPLIVSRSDLVVTLPRRLADIFTGAANLAICAPPIPLKKLSIYQLWHERRQNDPAHAWLRAFIHQRIAAIDKK